MWCSWCAAVCPGHDAEGYCLDADRREIDARLARLREYVARFAEPEPARELAAPVTWDANAPGAWRWAVWLDGVKRERCVLADAAAGEVTVVLTNERGIEYGCLKDQDDRCETLTGHVEIRRR